MPINPFIYNICTSGMQHHLMCVTAACLCRGIVREAVATQGAFGRKLAGVLSEAERERLKQCMTAISSAQPRHAWQQLQLSAA